MQQDSKVIEENNFEEILNYIGLNMNENYQEDNQKPEYNIAKAYDNNVLYKIYKKININDIVILISNTDRTTDIKERYETAKPIFTYIKENKNDFKNIVERASIQEIKKLENIQEEFKTKIPYFIKYDKNYLWQIYYSKADDKYFMLFPAKEGETSVVLYLLKEQLKKEDNYIYIPICKEEYSEEILSKKQISDMENYIWLFTNQFPTTYEYTTTDGSKTLFLIGETNIQENLKTKYKIEIKNKDEAEKQYALFKALFILTTETNYNYEFEPRLDEMGKLVLTYNDKIISFDNLEQFIKTENLEKRTLEKSLNTKIGNEKKYLEELKQQIKEQTDTYAKQEKQIVMFLNCKKSFFKRIKFFFSGNKKLKLKIKNDEELPKKDTDFVSEEVKQEENNQEEIVSRTYSIADLIKICTEAKKIIEEEKNISADIKALELKKENMIRKIENAQNYIEEIEKHKKSIFDFWKFTNKDNLPELSVGEKKEVEAKVKIGFNFEEDLPELMIKADELQRRKLSIDECNSIYLCDKILPAINSSICKCDTYKIGEEYEKLVKEYSPINKISELFGGIEDDYTKIKTLNNRKHRENQKNIYSILKINQTTSVDDFKNIIKEKSRLVNEAYQKITSICSMPIYYTNKQKGFTIGNINPYKLFQELECNKIYKMNLNENSHILYMSNIIFYDNYNKTLPLGMDESTEVIIKVGENRKISEKNINILIEKDLYNVEIKQIKLIEEQ